MHLRSIVLSAAVLAVGARAGAQDVRVEVVEASTGKPIVGANVALLDSAAPFRWAEASAIRADEPTCGLLRRQLSRPRRQGRLRYLDFGAAHLGDKPVIVRAGNGA